MESVTALQHSVISGLFAALSGFFGKLTFDSAHVTSLAAILEVRVSDNNDVNLADSERKCEKVYSNSNKGKQTRLCSIGCR